MSTPEHQATKPPALRDKKSRSEQFASDLIYTLNHAIVCGTTDIIDPFIGNWTEHKFGKRVSITFHNHDDHDGGHGHEHHDHHHKESAFGNLKEWIVGEAVGDVGAVPATLAMQYVAPSVMNGIRTLTEPVLGGLFWWASGRNARHWGYEHGFEPNSPEVQARREEIYEHEVSHLPHAFLWTGFAAAGNVMTQKLMTPHRYVSDMIKGKAAGSIGTLVTVLALRTLAPKTVEKIDRFNSDNIAEPLTRRIGSWFGIDNETVSRVLEREREFETGEQIIDEAKKHIGVAHDAPKKQVLAAQAQLTTPALAPINHPIG